MKNLLWILVTAILGVSSIATADNSTLLSPSTAAIVQEYLNQSANQGEPETKNFSILRKTPPSQRVLLNMGYGMMGGSVNPSFMRILRLIIRDLNLPFGEFISERMVILHIIPEQEKAFYSIEAYSSNLETHIFLAQDELTADHFALRLLHEIAIVTDDKILPEPADRQLCQALQNPIIKAALSSLRAYEVERQIFAKKGLKKNQALQYLDQMTCEQKILHVTESVYRYVYGHADLLNKNGGVIFSCTPAGLPGDHLQKDLQNLLKTFSSVQNSSECLTLLSPSNSFRGNGDFVLDLQSGPRPRVGNGWGGNSGQDIISDERKIVVENPAVEAFKASLEQRELNTWVVEKPKVDFKKVKIQFEKGRGE